MPQYVDGFVIPVPKRNLAAYAKMARAAARIWMDLGALEYRECVGDDLRPMGVTPFPRLFPTRPGETIVFSWIVYRSRQHRDAVNKKVMADPRIHKMMAAGEMPFDAARMAYGGFTTIVAR